MAKGLPIQRNGSGIASRNCSRARKDLILDINSDDYG
jgi:hypothetical protein